MTEVPGPSLADARSPFLRHGAEQPVGWMPWGDAAFERARREDRPILLDIGAVWCHWCHVMDHESYEDAETARLINDLYVPVKVDRDERPDVDARYQRAVQAVSGQGGWPLTAFLTPEGEVFYGGTYFPPEDGYGRPSFRRVLRELARVWREERERAVEAARSVRTRLSAYEQAESEPGTVTTELVAQGIEAFAKSFDFRYGGFGGPPKFPNAGALRLLLDHALDGGEAWAQRIVAETLTAMARGGIRDHLGGGFHRYATDARWLVPHFEKMAPDNGALLECYAIAHAVLGDPLFRATAEGIVEYYRDVAPERVAAGGFPASQDADVGPGDDGDYWTWTVDEVRRALGGEESLVRAAVLRYGLEDPASGMPTDPARHVLYLAAGADEVAARMGVEVAEAERLLDEVAHRLEVARRARPRPFVDETSYAGWSALVASGHVAAARYLGREDAGAAALRALDRIWEEAFDVEDGVAHRVDAGAAGGMLEDQAYTAQALLDAFEWTQRPDLLDRARAVADVMLERFREPESGAFTDLPRGGGDAVAVLSEPHRPIADAPSPSGNAVAAMVLLRLAALTGASAYRERGEETLRAFAGTAARMPTAVATYFRAVAWATQPVATLVVVGDEADAAAQALLRAGLSTYRPRTVVRRLAPGADVPESLPPELRAMVTGESPRAYLCVGRTCAAPVAGPDALVDLLRTFGG
ncbi:MAG TPA: thioredoxin domain-containing protein [Longimicrobiales bacterium]